MQEYRDRSSGKIMTKAEVKAANPNISAPKIWSQATYDAFNIDLVLQGSEATTTAYQISVRDGEEKNSNGEWVQKFVAKDMFADIEGGQTKAEQEAAYKTQLDNQQAEAMRATRNKMLAETDWWAVSDRTMTSEQTAYRKSLRDLSTHSNWPYIKTEDWPTKP